MKKNNLYFPLHLAALWFVCKYIADEEWKRSVWSSSSPWPHHAYHFASRASPLLSSPSREQASDPRGESAGRTALGWGLANGGGGAMVSSSPPLGFIFKAPNPGICQPPPALAPGLGGLAGSSRIPMFCKPSVRMSLESAWVGIERSHLSYGALRPGRNIVIS